RRHWLCGDTDSFARVRVRQTKGTDTRRIVRCTFLQVITHVPNGAVVARIDRGLSIVLPAVRVRLRRFAFHQDRLTYRQLAKWIVRESAREALARKVRVAAERVADADVALGVDGRASHPAVQAVRSESALLVELDIAFLVQSEFVPTNTAAASGRLHRMR